MYVQSTPMFLPPVFSRVESVRRDSMYVYHQDVDLTNELTHSAGVRKTGKLLCVRSQANLCSMLRILLVG